MEDVDFFVSIIDPDPEITEPPSPVTLGVGSREFLFRATDSSGNSALCSVAVEVVGKLSISCYLLPPIYFIDNSY